MEVFHLQIIVGGVKTTNVDQKYLFIDQKYLFSAIYADIFIKS